MGGNDCWVGPVIVNVTVTGSNSLALLTVTPNCAVADGDGDSTSYWEVIQGGSCKDRVPLVT